MPVKKKTKKIADDTICAIATPAGFGAIAIIRLSGRNSFAVCHKVFKGKNLKQQSSHSIHYGFIIEPGRNGKNGSNKIIDEVLVSIFKAPHSYTGEDVIEISCHGSVYIQQEILNLLVKSGARLAAPGEFTLRAFLNGRLDLSQAEAVADLIASGSESTHKVAMHQMRGGFSREIKLLRDELVKFASLIELELDFSEEDVEFAKRDELKELVKKTQEMIGKLIRSFKTGNVIKNGIPVVIAGKPNVGKSTLLNALLNDERAIVSDIPGTTRDTIEDEINLGGVAFRFIDTAGIRETSDEIESIGVKRTLEKIKSATVIIYLFDVHEITSRELNAIEISIEDEMKGTDARLLLVGNKIDKEDLSYIRNEFSGFDNIIYISAKEKTNLEQLTLKLLSLVNIEAVHPDETVITNVRHYEALSHASESLETVSKGLNDSISGELLATDIRKALHHLGTITGEVTSDEILGSIFSRFCIGK